jgi:hypothetical protein
VLFGISFSFFPPHFQSMHTSTFSQKANPTWLFCQVLLFFCVFGAAFHASAQAPTLTATTVFITANSGTSTTYDANNISSVNPDFNGANLGNIDINGGTLLLTGGTATTAETGNNTVSSVVLYYRVPAITSVFAGIELTQNGNGVKNADGSTTRTFGLSTANVNLLQGIGTIGTYNVEVYLQASYSDGTNSSLSITDNNVDKDSGIGRNYVASFNVTGTPIVNTIWTGATNDNWFEPTNWTSGVPTATSDATIRNLGSASSNPYPNIYSSAVKPRTEAVTTTTNGVTTIVTPEDPGYDNTNSGNAMVRNLFMEGSSSIEKSILRLVVGRLEVLGDFTDIYGSFTQREATTISFKATEDQTISGAPNGLVNVEIDGGAASVKTLTTSFKVLAGGSLKFINGILQTTGAPLTNFVELGEATGILNTNTYVAPAQLVGETELSYLRGYLKTTQVATVGSRQDFSNIGLSLSFTGNEPGPVTVNRTTNDNNTDAAFGGVAPSIRRVFQVIPRDQSTSTGGLTAKVEITYLDNELTNLRTTSGSAGSVDESKLALFVSENAGNTYSQLGRDADVNTGDNMLTKSGVSTFGFFTLSEQQTPLPVELIAFDAKRSGANALVTWATASEISNSGFEVQVSTDGVNFRKLAFVTSQAINSNATLNYSYLDEEKGKVGTRYYRLRQLDQDGSSEYSPVRAVTFSGAGNQMVAFSAHPNPYNANDAVKLSLGTSSVGTASLRVSDLMGRVVANQTFTTVNGTTEVALDQAAKLSAGTYLVQVVLASGETKTVRIQKH